MHEPTEYKKPRYCSRCHTLIWDEGATACPNCKGGDFVSEIDEKEVRDYSREAHNHDIAGYDLFNNAMCFIVIGGTALIIGVLFVFLSLIRRRNKIVGINPVSFQFFVAVAGLAVGLVLVVWGVINLVRAILKRKQAAIDIAYLAARRTK